MKLEDLSSETIEKLSRKRYDNYMRKHEGPEDWGFFLKPMEASSLVFAMDSDFIPENHMAELIEIENEWVLLPLEKKRHEKLTILHHFFSEGRQKLVLYIKDNNYETSPFEAGYVAICDLFFPEEFYVATFYHRWFMIDYDETARQFFKIED